MKRVFFLLLIVLTSCVSKEIKPSGEIVAPLTEIVYVEVPVIVPDTILIQEITKLENKVSSLERELKFYRDSIPYDVYINARRIEKIKYYIRITESRPTNQKFFYGWIRRTMNED